ncbi:hypothetical protein GCM10010420_55280 [Streptomyces glaucosporus]|uniref:Uncharacterized protein n=1 Tax=Streptomyces glaucosporus TaxID=284044 RepID=A0ABP5W268_9ACTN
MRTVFRPLATDPAHMLPPGLGRVVGSRRTAVGTRRTVRLRRLDLVPPGD